MSLTSTRPAPLMTRLNTEWTTLIAEKEHQFGSLGTATSAAILKRIRASKNTAQDAVLYELVTLAHGGDRTAERVLLQALIPAAQRMAHRVRSLDDFDRHDRVGYAIGAAWESIQRYKLHLRGRVMANLTMNMLGILAPEKSANDRIIADRTTPVATDVLEAEAGAWVTPEPTPEERLVLVSELLRCHTEWVLGGEVVRSIPCVATVLRTHLTVRPGRRLRCGRGYGRRACGGKRC